MHRLSQQPRWIVYPTRATPLIRSILLTRPRHKKASHGGGRYSRVRILNPAQSILYPVVNAMNQPFHVEVGIADKDNKCWPTASTVGTMSIHSNLDSPKTLRDGHLRHKSSLILAEKTQPHLQSLQRLVTTLAPSSSISRRGGGLRTRRTSHPQYPRQCIHSHLDMTCI